MRNAERGRPNTGAPHAPACCHHPVVASLFATSAWGNKVEQVVPLKNGWTALVFGDGKMSMRDDKGRVRSVRPNTQLEAADSRTVVMRGDETWRRTPAEKELEWLYRGSR